MLFNSFEFLFAFLPVTVVLFFALEHFGMVRLSKLWIVALSLFFYGWWEPVYVLLILFSIGFNFLIGERLSRIGGHRGILALGVGLNLGLLGYFKYAHFVVGSLGTLAGAEWTLGAIVLPLGISFFTFQQIAFLVDAHTHQTEEHRLIDYATFVTFFPQLIAGPIVHHKEMMSQFAGSDARRFSWERAALGLTLLAIGLFKKTIIADSAGVYADPLFAAAENGEALTFLEAWGGVGAFTFQIYFDFSAYSDMAVGIAHMFGIRLPLNFFSPYKATNIIDFWRTWHITLSRFLRQYLYFPLGGNRNGTLRRHTNLLTVMLLGGLWHGAGWNFVVWGGLHGLYLIVNHAWRALGIRVPFVPTSLGRVFSWALTFLAVTVAWTFFRAESFDGAVRILDAMTNSSGWVIPAHYADRMGALGPLLVSAGWRFEVGLLPYFGGLHQAAILAAMLFIVIAMPNAARFVGHFQPVLVDYLPHRSEQEIKPGRLSWKPNWRWAFVISLLFLFGVMMMPAENQFIYFQF